jgi:undecaprenyl diphosphate synthase
MLDLINQIDKTALPKHIAIIMDGNGRWAKNKGLPRIEGHQKGAYIVEEITEAARETGIKYLTLYAFSKENWNRPTDETKALMFLLFDFLQNKKEKMLKNGIRLNAIGDLSQLPEEVLACLNNTIKETSVGKEMVLTLALSYGARDEIIRAIKSVANELVQKKISTDHLDETLFSQQLDTHDMPDPDLIIRTSGEMRISNFLLWQGAYSEFIFMKPCWPEFSRELFLQCLIDYQARERRFGMTSEQLD